MRIVLDTNVLVAAAINPSGPPARVVGLLLDRRIDLVVSDEIFTEYSRVLGRAGFGFDLAAAEGLLYSLMDEAHRVLGASEGLELPDADDVVFLAAAVAGGADCICTGNKRHFPARACRGVQVTSPREFLDLVDQAGQG